MHVQNWNYGTVERHYGNNITHFAKTPLFCIDDFQWGSLRQVVLQIPKTDSAGNCFYVRHEFIFQYKITKSSLMCNVFLTSCFRGGEGEGFWLRMTRSYCIDVFLMGYVKQCYIY